MSVDGASAAAGTSIISFSTATLRGCMSSGIGFSPSRIGAISSSLPKHREGVSHLLSWLPTWASICRISLESARKLDMNRLPFVSLLVLATLLGTSACAGSDEVPEPTTTDQLESCYELVYEVDLTNIGVTTDEAMEATFLVIDRMLLDLIPSGPWPPVFTDAMVEIQGEDRIKVRLTDVQDIGLVISTIDQTPALDFRELTDESRELVQDQIDQGELVDYDSLTGEGVIEWKSSTGTDSSGREVHLTGRHVKGNARATTHPDTGQSHVVIEFRPDGVGLLSQIGGRLHAAADSPGNSPPIL